MTNIFFICIFTFIQCAHKVFFHSGYVITHLLMMSVLTDLCSLHYSLSVDCQGRTLLQLA